MLVEQSNSESGTVWWNNEIVMVEQWNSVGGIVEQCWWNSGTVMVEQWNSVCGTVLWNSAGGTVEQ